MLDTFQHICDQNNFSIGVGMPTLHASGLMISMLIFQAYVPRQVYAKQQLHADELPYFVHGDRQVPEHTIH